MSTLIVNIKITLSILLVSVIMISCQEKVKDRDPFKTWRHYGGDKGQSKYSSLSQIDTTNVDLLKPLWKYHSGDVDEDASSQIQCTPIIIGRTLFGVNPKMKLFALDALTGEEKWKFDVRTDIFSTNPKAYHIMINSRGITYWENNKKEGRIFFTAGSKLYAVNANSGKPIREFGENGYIDLHKDLGRNVDNYFVVNTSPVMVFKNLIITGSRVDESPPSAPGHIRAYHAETGEHAWTFHTIPHPGESGYETWEDSESYKYIGGANVWSGFALDEEREILFAPTGSATYDFYGGKRKGINLYANCLLALDAKTGKRKWHYQFVHHDLWDKDLPTPPTLVTINLHGKEVDAVAQTTKNGELFLFNRETGKPIFEIKEERVDTISDLIGEKVYPTQPKPIKPEPFTRQSLKSSDIIPYVTPQEQDSLKRQLSTYRYGHRFLPPSITPTVLLPGFDGGAEWGGAAFDPKTKLLYVNSNEIPWLMEMVANPEPIRQSFTYLKGGQYLYEKNCASCHLQDFSGSGNNPSLHKIYDHYSKGDIARIISEGQRMMPAFPQLTPLEKEAIADYLKSDTSLVGPNIDINPSKEDSIHHVPYKIKGYTKWTTEKGFPAINPPWGRLSAINLNTGKYAWSIPFGNEPALQAMGITGTGAENYGGPIVTAGGLLIIGAAKDGYLRIYNKRTGEEIWKYELPAPAFSTPALYEIDGTQIIVIACGGGKLGTKSSDIYMAFHIPDI